MIDFSTLNQQALNKIALKFKEDIGDLPCPEWFSKPYAPLTLETFEWHSQHLGMPVLFLGNTGLHIYIKTDSELHFLPNGTPSSTFSESYDLTSLHTSCFLAGVMQLALWYSKEGKKKYPYLSKISVGTHEKFGKLMEYYFDNISPDICIRIQDPEIINSKKYEINLGLLAEMLLKDPEKYLLTKISNRVERLIDTSDRPQMIHPFVDTYDYGDKLIRIQPMRL